MKNKKGNIATIIFIVLIVAITIGVIAWLFIKKAPTPEEKPIIPKTSTPSPKKPQPITQPTTQTKQPETGNWKEYVANLSKLSPQFANKTISFNYPSQWGEVTSTFEKSDFLDDLNKSFNVLSLKFSSFPGDKDLQDFNLIKIVDYAVYAAALPDEVIFLQRATSVNGPVSETELNTLKTGLGKGIFFGVNIAKKFTPQQMTSMNKPIGITFFMRDSQDYSTDLSYNALLLDQKTNVIMEGQFLISSKQQDQLEQELNELAIDDAEKIKAWDEKMDALAKNSYTTNPDYMKQANDINIVMQSIKVN